MILLFRLIDTTNSVVWFDCRHKASVGYVVLVGLSSFYLIKERSALGLTALRAGFTTLNNYMWNLKRGHYSSLYVGAQAIREK